MMHTNPQISCILNTAAAHCFHSLIYSCAYYRGLLWGGMDICVQCI